jgi:hypothetical protein
MPESSPLNTAQTADNDDQPRPWRRQAILSLLALPAACAFRPLPSVQSAAVAPPPQQATLRPAALGQRWTYRKYNGFNGALLATETDEVTALAPDIVIRRSSDRSTGTQDELQQPWGLVLRDLSWDHVQIYEQALPWWPADPTPGARSVLDTHYRLDKLSYRYWIQVRTTVRGWEEVELAGGKRYRTLRVEHYIRQQHADISRIQTTRRDTLWLAPEVGRWVVRDIQGEYLVPDDKGAYRGLEAHHRWELADWR